MNSSATASKRVLRRPPSPLAKLALAALLGLAAVILITPMILAGEIEITSLIISVVLLLVGVVVATGWRWTPALGALVAALLLAALVALAGTTLTQPRQPDFAPTVLMVALAFVAMAAGIWATIQNYHGGEAWAPGWLPYGLIALGGVVLGAFLVALTAQPAVSAGVSPELLAQLPVVSAGDFSFSQKEIRVNSGEMVVLRLENDDPTAHDFTIDELGFSSPMVSGESGLALFRPTKPGAYTFYCSIPGHANLTARTGMFGTLIVEP